MGFALRRAEVHGGQEALMGGSLRGRIWRWRLESGLEWWSRVCLPTSPAFWTATLRSCLGVSGTDEACKVFKVVYWGIRWIKAPSNVVTLTPNSGNVRDLVGK